MPQPALRVRSQQFLPDHTLSREHQPAHPSVFRVVEQLRPHRRHRRITAWRHLLEFHLPAPHHVTHVTHVTPSLQVSPIRTKVTVSLAVRPWLGLLSGSAPMLQHDPQGNWRPGQRSAVAPRCLPERRRRTDPPVGLISSLSA
ncbi:hypothetical protein FRAHR75_950002 [Frankia sp. Hr75.2]|nr:hypothetical protein FRAHR75_950002 [Frankia sp. Hr75.2]